MAADLSKETRELFELICMKLGLGSSAIVGEQPVAGAIRPDMVIEEGNKRFFVEVKPKANADTVARMALLRALLQKKKGIEHHFVIASRAITPDVEDIAKQAGVKLVRLPHGTVPPARKYAQAPSKVKITSEKSWRIVSRLLKEKAASIRRLSLLEKVSYGWAHATVQSLIMQGIVEKKGNYVRISDVDKLLNGIAWERPFANLFAAEIRTDYKDAFKAARELTRMLKGRNINFAFTSYTAGGLYTGYAARQDSVYLYLEKKDIDLFARTFPDEEQKGIGVRVYLPDREIFGHAQEKEGVLVASPAQTLLDLAGLGYSGRDMAKAMADNYAAI